MTHTNAPASHLNHKLLIRGIHLTITDAMRAVLHEKVERLLRHESRIDRVRIDLDHDTSRGRDVFIAKGHIEIGGPDLLATVASDDAYKAANLLIDKLDRMLNRRNSLFKARRHRNDHRAEITV